MGTRKHLFQKLSTVWAHAFKTFTTSGLGDLYVLGARYSVSDGSGATEEQLAALPMDWIQWSRVTSATTASSCYIVINKVVFGVSYHKSNPHQHSVWSSPCNLLCIIILFSLWCMASFPSLLKTLMSNFSLRDVFISTAETLHAGH